MSEQLSLARAAAPTEPPDQAARELIRTATGDDAVRRGRRRRRQDDRARRAHPDARRRGRPDRRHRRHHVHREGGGRAPPPPARSSSRAGRSTPRRRAALDGLDHAPIGTLHAFARRILFEFPVEAGLPPGFTVLDDLESQLALDERWEDLLDELLDDAGREVVPGPAGRRARAARPVGHVRRLPRAAPRDRGLPGQLGPRRAPRRPPSRPPGRGRPTAAARPDRDARRHAGAARRPPGRACSRASPPLADAGRRSRRHRPGAGRARTRSASGSAKPRRAPATRTNWRHHGGRDGARRAARRARSRSPAVVDAHLGEWRRYRQAVVGAVCGRFVLDGATARAAAGTLEFHDLLVLARRLLATDAGARRRLHERYQRLLLDEFQDTDPIQLEIAVRLTAPTGRSAAPRHRRGCGRSPAGCSSSATRSSRSTGSGGPTSRRTSPRPTSSAPTTATLSANFRSTDAVIDWVNGVFGDGDPARGGRPTGLRTARRLPAGAARPRHGPRARRRPSTTATTSTPTSCAGARRRRSPAPSPPRCARAGRSATATAGLRPCRPGDIAVLLPARTSLPMLEGALGALGHPVPGRERHRRLPRAGDPRPAAGAARRGRPDRRARARGRRCARRCTAAATSSCSTWRRAGGRFDLPPRRPTGMRATTASRSALAHLASIDRDDRHGVARRPPRPPRRRAARARARARPGPTPATCGGGSATSLDQARAWTDAGGRGVRRYLRWARYQAERGTGERHDPARARPRRRAGDDGARGQGPGVPDHRRHGHDHRGPPAATARPSCGSTTRGRSPRRATSCSRSSSRSTSRWATPSAGACCTSRARGPSTTSSCPLHRKPLAAPRRPQPRSPSAHVLARPAGRRGHGATVLDDAAVPVVAAAAEPLELPWPDAGEWREERERAMAAGRVAVGDERHRASPWPSTRPAPTTAPVERAPSRTPMPGSPRTGSTSTCRRGSAAATAPPSAAPCTPCCRTPTSPPATTSTCSPRRSARPRASSGWRRTSPRCAARRSAAPIVAAAADGAEHWRELFVVAELGDHGARGVHRPARAHARRPRHRRLQDRPVAPGADQQRARVARYRHQLAAYGCALGRLLDEPIAGGVLVRCRAGRSRRRRSARRLGRRAGGGRRRAACAVAD